MCGIVGYTGSREAEPILLTGLSRLEYRGYDSAGLATLAGPDLCLRKSAGRIADLGRLLAKQPAPGTLGISHTRWATHGGATDKNAHPHIGGNGVVAVVHNGVIENYAIAQAPTRTFEGVRVSTRETDTEVVAQSDREIHHGRRPGRRRSPRYCPMLKGTYGLGVCQYPQMSRPAGRRPGSVARWCVGIGDGEHVLGQRPGRAGGAYVRKCRLPAKTGKSCVSPPPTNGDCSDAGRPDRGSRCVEIEKIDEAVTDDRTPGRFPTITCSKRFSNSPEALENAPCAGRLDRRRTPRPTSAV